MLDTSQLLHQRHGERSSETGWAQWFPVSVPVLWICPGAALLHPQQSSSSPQRVCSSGWSTLLHCQVSHMIHHSALSSYWSNFVIRSEHDQPMSNVPTFFPHELPDSHPQFSSLSFPTQIRIAPAPIGQQFPQTVPIGQIQQRPQPTQVPKICDFVECEQGFSSSTTSAPTTTSSSSYVSPVYCPNPCYLKSALDSIRSQVSGNVINVSGQSSGCILWQFEILK